MFPTTHSAHRGAIAVRTLIHKVSQRFRHLRRLYLSSVLLYDWLPFHASFDTPH